MIRSLFRNNYLVIIGGITNYIPRYTFVNILYVIGGIKYLSCHVMLVDKMTSPINALLTMRNDQFLIP